MLFHVVVERVHPKTGERLDRRQTVMTATPCTHAEACTIKGKINPYRTARMATRTSLVPA